MDQLDNQPIADEAETETETEAEQQQAPEPEVQPEQEQEHRGHIPGVSDPANGMLLVGHVTIR